MNTKLVTTLDRALTWVKTHGLDVDDLDVSTYACHQIRVCVFDRTGRAVAKCLRALVDVEQVEISDLDYFGNRVLTCAAQIAVHGLAVDVYGLIPGDVRTLDAVIALDEGCPCCAGEANR